MQVMLTKYFIVLILIMLAHSANSVHAALLTEVTFNQELPATDRQSGTQLSSLPFAGNTIPAHGSRALGASYGGFIGADYDFTPYSFLTLIQGGVSSGSGILSGNGHIVLTLTSVPIPGR